MRISEDRYSRDRRRIDIALQFIRHEARTRTIRHWTGLTDDRIRKLYRSYLRESPVTTPVRHRGKSPQQVAFFLRTTRLRQDTALLASLYCLVGALTSLRPERSCPLPDISRGELLCQAYEVYRHLCAEPLISFEHAVFLLTSLERGDELSLQRCRDCGALLVTDGICLRLPRCLHCSDCGGDEAFTADCRSGTQPE